MNCAEHSSRTAEQEPHLLPRFIRMRTLGAILAGCLLLGAFHTPASSQTSLDDVVVRAFDIDVSVFPVPLRYEFAGADVQFLSHGTLRGTTTALLEVVAPDPVTAIRFLFDSDVKLTSVKAPDYEVASARQGDTLILTFTPALPPRSKVPVTFIYEGQPQYIYDEFVRVFAWSLYPVLVSPFSDLSPSLARVKLRLTTPGGYNIAGTGKLLSREGDVLTFDSEVPVPLVAIAGGRKHTVRERTVSGVTMQFYVPPGEDRNLDKLADFAGKSVNYYSKLLYPYPYTELRVVSLFIVSGGIGYPAFLLIDDRAFKNTFRGDLNRDSFLFQLIAHEAAHSYVPAQTVPRGVGFIWLSEGFAEYLSLMAVEAVLGPEAFKRELQEERNGYSLVAATALREPAIGSVTFANYHGAAFGVIYHKGALVLHMLRGVLGDEVFKKGLAMYFTTFRGRTARVSDFQEVMEKVAGQPLDWFFREWIQERVLPNYTIVRATSTPLADGAFQTSAVVRNLGKGEMPVEVGFTSSEGETVIQKVTVFSEGDSTVSVTTSKPVKQVEVDPHHWLIQRDYTHKVFPIP